uniref:Uncharacterized protein n=1 Tax=Scophthalmus maximus TaxID=52904 RepID=A0A8D3E6T7_SCOMX
VEIQPGQEPPKLLSPFWTIMTIPPSSVNLYTKLKSLRTCHQGLK